MGAPEKGWIQVTPLLSNDGTRAVLVRRGWVPDRWRQQGRWHAVHNPTIGSGVGVVSGGEVGNSFVPDNKPEEGEWFTLDPAAMVRLQARVCLHAP